MTTVRTAEQESFARTLRRRTQASHRRAESTAFVEALFGGRLEIGAYVSMVVQHAYIYEALEGCAQVMADDPVAGCFVDPLLTRTPSLRRDLDQLLGEPWTGQVAPLPATAAYCARIREVGTSWSGGFVAHHYTRYLGDLSGGLHIRDAVGRRFGLVEDGVRFYRFDIPDPTAYKDRYRGLLDAAPWDAAEREMVVEETLVAYAHNAAVFEELAVEVGVA